MAVAHFDPLRDEEEDLADHMGAPLRAPPSGGAGGSVAPGRRALLVLWASAFAGAAAVVGLACFAPAGAGMWRVSAGLRGIQEKAANEAPTPETAQARFRSREKLEIQKDLGVVVTAHLPRGAAPEEGVSPKDAAGTLFDHVVEASGLRQELTRHERAAFRSRFVQELSAAEDEAEGHRGLTAKYVKAAQAALEQQKPVMTESLAKQLNELELGFTTKAEPWMQSESQEAFRRRLGRLPMTKGQVEKLKAEGKIDEQRTRAAPRDPLPVQWDAREEWPECAHVIGRILNQGHCGSCWVFGALAPLDDRMCIKSLGAEEQYVGTSAMLSRGFATSCSIPDHDGCQGGWEYLVYDYIEQSSGVPTTACSPYFASGPGTEHFEETQTAPACPASCSNTAYPRSIAQDYFQPRGVAQYQIVIEPTPTDVEYVKSRMLAGGPCSFAFAVTNEFFGYESGIWNLGCGSDPNHAVHTIGWGDGYLLAQNSWDVVWGDRGRFKVAPCIPYEFTIAGDFDGSALGPLPIPTAGK